MVVSENKRKGVFRRQTNSEDLCGIRRTEEGRGVEKGTQSERIYHLLSLGRGKKKKNFMQHK